LGINGGHLSAGGPCGCVREPGSRTLPFGVGFVFFSTKSKKHKPHLVWGVCFLRLCRKTQPPHQNGLAYSCVRFLFVCKRSLHRGKPR
jgi:hypothetical protein